MPSSIPKPHDISPDDLLDRTLELDLRWLQYEKPEAPVKARNTAIPDDPTVVLDLTATQVHELLNRNR